MTALDFNDALDKLATRAAQEIKLLRSDTGTAVGNLTTAINTVSTWMTNFPAAVITMTNKRITKRVVSGASTATLTIDSDATDVSELIAQAAALTIAAPIGTPTNGQPLWIRIKDAGAAKAITWNAIFRVYTGVTLPVTTVVSKWTIVGLMYNANDSKWDVVGVLQEP